MPRTKNPTDAVLKELRKSEGQTLPVALLKAWIDESYRAQAPKKLVASLAAAKSGPTGAGKAAAPRKKRRAPRSRAARSRRATKRGA